LGDTDTDISVSANRILALAISVSASVLAYLYIGYISIGQISDKIHGYRPKYRHISAKMKISVLVLVANMLLLIYPLNIGQNENIVIGIGGRYVGSNLSVSAKILAGKIYRYRLEPYRSNPNH
jgi:hypothetical protein